MNHHVDERYHVEKLTRLPVVISNKAYARFGNWETVAASYNADRDASRANKTSNHLTENALDLHLVEETARYIYRILAVKIMLANPSQFGFHLRASDLYPPVPYRNIKVTSTINDLARFAKSHGITYALLRNMNPWLRIPPCPTIAERNI